MPQPLLDCAVAPPAAALPLDELRCVFQLLDCKCLLRASAVCRAWNAAAGDDRLWEAHLQWEFRRPPALHRVAGASSSARAAFMAFKDSPAGSHQAHCAHLHSHLADIAEWRCRIREECDDWDTYVYRETMQSTAVHVQEQSVWVRFDLPKWLKVVAADVYVEALWRGTWVPIITSTNCEVPEDDKAMLLQSHTEGLYVWDAAQDAAQNAAQGAAQGAAQNAAQNAALNAVLNAVLNAPGAPEDDQQQDHQQLFGDMVHLQNGQLEFGGVDHQDLVNFVGHVELKMVAYMHYEQLLQELGPSAHQMLPLAPPLLELPGSSTVWQYAIKILEQPLHLAIDFCCLPKPPPAQPPPAAAAAAAAAPSTSALSADADSPCPGAPKTHLGKMVMNLVPAGCIGHDLQLLASECHVEWHPAAVADVASSASAAVACHAAARQGSGHTNSQHSAAEEQDVAAQLGLLLEGEELMADFALLDAQGRLLLGRAGVELWGKEQEAIGSELQHDADDALGPNTRTVHCMYFMVDGVQDDLWTNFIELCGSTAPVRLQLSQDALGALLGIESANDQQEVIKWWRGTGA